MTLPAHAITATPQAALPAVLRADAVGMGLAANFVKIGPIGAVVTPAARAALEQARAKLIAGETVIFSGPLKDNKGNIVVPAGTAYQENDRALDPINYLVDGVIGQA